MTTAEMWASPLEWIYLCVGLSLVITVAFLGYVHGRLQGVPLLMRFLPLDLAVAVMGFLAHRGFPAGTAGSAMTVGLALGGLCYWLSTHFAAYGTKARPEFRLVQGWWRASPRRPGSDGRGAGRGERVQNPEASKEPEEPEESSKSSENNRSEESSREMR